MTIDMPSTLGFVRSSNFYLQTNTQVFESPITRDTQTKQLPGARWVMEVTLRRMKRAEAAKWIAFIMKLRGRSETFYGFDPDWKTNLGPCGGTPLVKGAGQTGTSLNIDGCTLSTLGWMKAGDYFSVGSELKRLTVDADANGSGETTLTFEPYLRSAPADNAAITVLNPKAVMKLTDDSMASWVSNENSIYEEKTLTAYESFS